MGKFDNVMEDKYASNAINFGEAKSPAADAKISFKDDAALKDMKGFASVDRQLQEDKEKEKKPDGLLARKMKRIFGAAGHAQTLFLQGFKMGAIVGGIFGGLTGIYYAYQTRQILVIPMIALTSGGSFGFFMGVGMIMRSEMEGTQNNDDDSSSFDVCIIKENGEVEYTPIYQKYQEKLL